MKTIRVWKSAMAAVCLAAGINASEAITIDLVNVGNAGNAADTTGYGAVSYDYAIGKYEVTIGQYTAFLNAVATTDPYGLYNANMGTDLNIAGIARSGSSGSYAYSVMTNSGSSANRPITYVSWFDAARFSNWMQNGQGNGSTETGAYTLNGLTSGIVLKNPDATWYIPSEDEWYKAAFNSPEGLGDTYTLYPTQSSTPPGNVIGDSANQANFIKNGIWSVTQLPYYSYQNNLTDGGAFSGSASFYGTYDQGGNAWEWNDAVILAQRGLRGGAYEIGIEGLPSSLRGSYDPNIDYHLIGFRVASVPEPSSVVLTLLAGAGLLVWKRRKL